MRELRDHIVVLDELSYEEEDERVTDLYPAGEQVLNDLRSALEEANATCSEPVPHEHFAWELEFDHGIYPKWVVVQRHDIIVFHVVSNLSLVTAFFKKREWRRDLERSVEFIARVLRQQGFCDVRSVSQRDVLEFPV